jgi:tyrosyl-tRNA synthetase
MFGKVMSISDELMWRWYDLVSARSNDEIAVFRREAAEGRNPRDIKALLAKEIVARFHSAHASDVAEREFNERFRAGVAPDDMPSITLAGEAAGGLSVAAVLKQAGLAPSSSEAVRNIEQGGVKVDGARVADRAQRLASGTYVIQVGKRKWARVTVG